MLSHVNRITSGSDYQAVVRRGVRRVGAHTVIYVRKTPTLSGRGENSPARFGFIVAKNVGNAVRRNTIRRRLKAASYDLLAAVEPGTDIVIRALPAANNTAWSVLRGELARAFGHSVQERKVSSKR